MNKFREFKNERSVQGYVAKNRIVFYSLQNSLKLLITTPETFRIIHKYAHDEINQLTLSMIANFWMQFSISSFDRDLDVELFGATPPNISRIFSDILSEIPRQ